MVAKTDQVARYNLALPTTLYGELQSVAKDEGITVVQLLRKFITLGLTLIKLSKRSPDAILVIREGDRETQILLI